MEEQEVISLLRTIAIDVSPVANAKIAAAIVYRGDIVSIGVCSYKSHPIMLLWGKNSKSIYLHAEVDAINKAMRKRIPLAKSTLYVVRVKRPSSSSDQWIDGLAKPCAGCMKAIDTVGIRNVIYTEG